MFCCNCAAEAPSRALCQKCGLDPLVTEAAIDAHLLRLRRGDVAESPLPIEEPGERASLALALGILLVVGGILSALTAGLILLAVLVAAIGVRVSQSRLRASLVHVTPVTDLRLAHIVKTAAFRLDLPAPEVFVQDDHHLQAFTLGLFGEHSIVVTSRLAEILTPAELLFVVGHEMGHAKREHVAWLVVGSSHPRPAGLLGSPLKLIFNVWSLKAEFSADRAGLLACRDLEAASRALIKLQYGDRPFDVESYLSQTRHTVDNPFSQAAEYLGDHPFIHNRVRSLQRFHAQLSAQGMV